MSALVYRIGDLLCRIVQSVPLGTNLGLFDLLWTILSGRLLGSRGAVIPALAATGLEVAAVRRAWAALTYGQWQCAQLLQAWQQVVAGEGRFQAACYGGYRPVAVDLVGFFRPHLRGCASKHYCTTAGKALPAIVLGLVASVGTVEGQRVPLLRSVVRAEAGDTSEADLQRRLLRTAQASLGMDEALKL